MEIKEAKKLLREKMDAHGLVDWKIDVLPKSRRVAGRCFHTGKKIYLGLFLTETRSEEEVLNTILHEIAHALVGSLEHPHCWIWKKKCVEIGGNGEIYWNKKQPHR